MKEKCFTARFSPRRATSPFAQDRLSPRYMRPPRRSRVCGVRSRGATIGEDCLDRAAFARDVYASAPGKKGPGDCRRCMSENAIESVEIVEFEHQRISAPARERVPQQSMELQSLT